MYFKQLNAALNMQTSYKNIKKYILFYTYSYIYVRKHIKEHHKIKIRVKILMVSSGSLLNIPLRQQCTIFKWKENDGNTL